MIRSRHTHELIALTMLGLGIAGFLVGHFWAQQITPQLSFFCFGVFVLCFILRIWVAGAAWGLAAAIGLSAIVPAYLPRLSVPRPGCNISVVTFNKLVEHPDDVGAAQFLVRLRPDVIFFQKVYGNVQFRDVLLAEGFRGYYSFPSPTKPDLILSRFPIVRTDDDNFGIWVDVVVEGREVRLKNMYVPRPNGDWRAYVAYYARLREEVRDHTGPLILAGDANATPFAPEIRALHEILQDAWNQGGLGLGFTFPGPWRRLGMLGPWLRIDYIFHNAALDTVSARRVDDVTGAGHYPVWAELRLVDAGKSGTPCE